MPAASSSVPAIEPRLRSIAPLAAELVPLMYADLRRAAHQLRRRSGPEALDTTELVHEAWLKLRNAEDFADRGHFLRAAALAMRHVLVNHVRDRSAAKRGGGASHRSLEELPPLLLPVDERLLEVNAALDRLARLSPRLAQVVECRYFAGYGDQETAAALGLTDRSVRRDWVKARAWLRRELADASLADVD